MHNIATLRLRMTNRADLHIQQATQQLVSDELHMF